MIVGVDDGNDVGLTVGFDDGDDGLNEGVDDGDGVRLIVGFDDWDDVGLIEGVLIGLAEMQLEEKGEFIEEAVVVELIDGFIVGVAVGVTVGLMTVAFTVVMLIIIVKSNKHNCMKKIPLYLFENKFDTLFT